MDLGEPGPGEPGPACGKPSLLCWGQNGLERIISQPDRWARQDVAGSAVLAVDSVALGPETNFLLCLLLSAQLRKSKANQLPGLIISLQFPPGSRHQGSCQNCFTNTLIQKAPSQRGEGSAGAEQL